MRSITTGIRRFPSKRHPTRTKPQSLCMGGATFDELFLESIRVQQYRWSFITRRSDVDDERAQSLKGNNNCVA